MAYLGIDRFIQDFDGGSRPTLFRVTVTDKAGVIKFTNRLTFYAKATSIPGSTLGEITVPYLGRQIKVPGDRTFEDWTVTVLNTEDYTIRNEFEKWNRYYNGIVNNMVGDITGASTVETSGPFWGHVTGCTATVEQLNRKGQTVQKYELVACYPKEVAAIELAYDQNDTVSEFQVTFGYTYFQVAQGPGAQLNLGGKR